MLHEMRKFQVSSEVPAAEGNWGPTKYSHTFWIDGRGKVINIPTGGPTHYSYISQHFKELFPDEEYSDSNVFDAPIRHGWVHVRNHFSTFSISGQPGAIRRWKYILLDAIDDRLELGEGLDDFAVDFTYYGDSEDTITRGQFLELPKDYDKVRDVLGNPGVSSLSSAARQKQKWIGQNRDVLQWMKENQDWSDFAKSLIKFYQRAGFLTVKQIAAVRNIVVKQSQRSWAGEQ